MGQRKGQTGNPGGKPKGCLNKTTVTARQAIASFVDANADRLVGWLDKIAENDPKDAFAAFMSVVEYHIPKLARTENKTEHTGSVGVSIINLGNDPSMIDKLKQLYTDKKSGNEVL
jgi:hypothetical protein